MTNRFKVVAVSGSVTNPSRTSVLAKQILQAVAALEEMDMHVVELAEIGSSIGQAMFRRQLPPIAEDRLRIIEQADLLIVATPVYRGAYAGLFKHLFDLIDEEMLAEKPVILAATGGSDRHSLIIEHGLRSLFSFFGAHTVPVGIYATPADFKDYQLQSGALEMRIAVAARQAVAILNLRSSNVEKLQAIA
jgi:FMN reductase